MESDNWITLPPSCVTGGKLLSLSWPQFPDTFHRGLLSSLDGGMQENQLGWCLAHSKCSIHVSCVFTPLALSSWRLHSVVSSSKPLCAKHCAPTGSEKRISRQSSCPLGEHKSFSGSPHSSRFGPSNIICIKYAENFPYLSFALHSQQFLFLFFMCLEQPTLPMNFAILNEF